jgi:hypothetical protein
MKLENDKIGRSSPALLSILHHVFSISHYALFLAIPQLILGGYCTYRERFDLTHILSAMTSSVLLVGGIHGLDWITDVNDAVICMIVVLVGFLWYVQIGMSHLFVFARLVNYVESRDDHFANKVRLASAFGQIFAVIAVFVVGAAFTSWAFEFWQIVVSVLIEIGVLAVVITEMKLFFLRKIYEGEPSRSDAPVVDMRSIEDPLGSEIAIVGPALS